MPRIPDLDSIDLAPRRGPYRRPKTADENLGPEGVASSPEALLIAAIIRQAIEDYKTTSESVAHIATRKYARRLLRRQAEAEKFLFLELPAFLERFDVAHLINAEAIARKLKPYTVPEHVVPLTQIQGGADADKDTSMLGGETGLRAFDRLLPRNQYGKYA